MQPSRGANWLHAHASRILHALPVASTPIPCTNSFPEPAAITHHLYQIQLRRRRAASQQQAAAGPAGPGASGTASKAPATAAAAKGKGASPASGEEGEEQLEELLKLFDMVEGDEEVREGVDALTALPLGLICEGKSLGKRWGC